jgi:hypothetical protein
MEVADPYMEVKAEDMMVDEMKAEVKAEDVKQEPAAGIIMLGGSSELVRASSVHSCVKC